MIIAIVAVAENNAIGKDGRLPWHYSADLKFFKERTTGNAIVMGSRTWASLGRPLPGRTNVVLSRAHADLPAGVVAVNSVDEVAAFARGFAGDTFIIGGAAVFRSCAKLIERWLVTEIPGVVDDADTFMPDDFLDGFELVESQTIGDELVVTTYKRSGA